MTDPINPLLKKLLKRNAKSRGKSPMAEDTIHSMLRATHGRFDNVQITIKRGKRVMICRGLSAWAKHDQLSRKRQNNGEDTQRSA